MQHLQTLKDICHLSDIAEKFRSDIICMICNNKNMDEYRIPREKFSVIRTACVGIVEFELLLTRSAIQWLVS